MTRWCSAAAVLLAALAAGCTPVHEYRRVVMGAECRILVAADEATADRAAEAAFRRLAEVEQALSDWMAASEVRQLPVRARTRNRSTFLVGVPAQLEGHASSWRPAGRAGQPAAFTRQAWCPELFR